MLTLRRGVKMADSFEEARRSMLERLKWRGVHDERVLRALSEVPRHLFVPPKFAYLSYTDVAIPVGEGQTSTPPEFVALVCQLAEIPPKAKVLELGTGTGYQAAVLSRLAAQVVTVEILENLSRRAMENLRRAGVGNVKVICQDGRLGLPDFAPYEVIIYAFGLSEVPREVFGQLRPKGRLVAPIGTRYFQRLWVFDSEGKGRPTIPVLYTWLKVR